MKKHLGFIIFLAFIISLFLGDLIIMKSSFLYGDYSAQFYPWSKIYSESIKKLQFPFWTRYFHSGFPLTAEGQTGSFYPLNIILFFLLPLNIAYNYSFVLHFILAAVFTYIYARKIGADQWGGALSAFLFCFGSAYAGCFYNIVTLRTLCWFPAVLLLIEEYFDTGRLKYILSAAVLSGIQFLAGFLQMAAYSFFFSFIYFLYRGGTSGFIIKKRLTAMAFFIVPVILISLPQVILTIQLTGYSGRETAGLGFALWRSFMPTGFLGLVFPFTLLAASVSLYVGVLSIFFIIYCFYAPKKESGIKGIILVLLVSLFFALGRYNPLYTAIIKLFKIYYLRNPSKFIFFSSFSLSILAGWGFSRFFSRDNKDNFKKAYSSYKLILAVFGIIFLAGNIVINVFKPKILALGELYIKSHICGKDYHRYDLSFYLNKLRLLYDTTAKSMSLFNIYTLSSWILLITGIFILPVLLKRRLKRLILLIIFADLFIFSFYGLGFRGNIQSFAKVIPENNALYNKIKSDKEIFRIMPYYIASGKLPNWAVPNANLMYGIDSIACYTPLANKFYKDALNGLEIVDDSLGLKEPEKDALRINMDLLRLLNTKYVVSPVALNLESLKMKESENNIFLYEIKDYLPRIFFTEGIKDIKPAAAEYFNIKHYNNGRAEIDIITNTRGYVVFSEIYYPGWKVFVDAEKKEIMRIKGLIQAVEIREGKHTVIFRFAPDWKP